MACACRALRALTLVRAPFQRPALLAPSYRAYSTDSPDSSSAPPTSETPKPSQEPSAPSTPSLFVPKKHQAAAAPTPEVAPKPRRRRTIGPKNPEPREKESWMTQKEALRRKFPLGWAPPKKLSPDALSGLRALHAQFPETYTTPALSELFGISPEAVRRILKSKWNPGTSEEEEQRRERWVRRGERVWERWAGMGVKVPRKWRPEGVSKWGGKVQKQGEEEAAEGADEEKKGVDRAVRTRRRVTGRIM